MNSLINFIFILILSFSLEQKDDPYYNKKGEPSSYGISKYVNDNADKLITEYEFMIDTLYDVYVAAGKQIDDFDSLELGVFYLPDYIYINSDGYYIAYEFKDLSKFRQKNVKPFQRTVKGVVFHELSHAYFYQSMILMKNDSLQVSPEYDWIRMFPTASSGFSSKFVEEGFCEYIVEKSGEQPINEVFIPKTKEDLLNENLSTDIIYGYSVYFLRDFLDKYGIKNGLIILLQNRPPTYEEILEPELYFKRLNYGNGNRNSLN